MRERSKQWVGDNCLYETMHNPLRGTNRNLSLEIQFFTSIYSKMSTDLRNVHCIPRFCLLALQISPYYSHKITFYKKVKDFISIKLLVVHNSAMVWSRCSSLRKPRMTSLNQLWLGFQMRYVRPRCSVLLYYFYSHLCKILVFYTMQDKQNNRQVGRGEKLMLAYSPLLNINNIFGPYLNT